MRLIEGLAASDQLEFSVSLGPDYDKLVTIQFAQLIGAELELLQDKPDILPMLMALEYREDLRLKEVQEQTKNLKFSRDYNPETGAECDDCDNDYILNSRGARSVEFFREPELMVSGCSQTYGVGVSVEATWGHALGELLNTKYVNISHQGASFAAIVSNIFAYIREFGKPKKLAVLFPDLFRFTTVSIGGFISKYGDEVREFVVEDLNVNSAYMNADKPKFSKKEHIWEDVIPQQLPIYLSMGHLNMLIQYCRDADIELVWGTWVWELDAFFSNFVKSSRNSDGFYDGYVQLNEDSGQIFGEKATRGCHSELKITYPDFFEEGLDRREGQHGHMGAHQHAHIAEDFFSRLSDK